MLIGRPNSKFLVNARMHRALDCTAGSSRENTTSKQNEMSNHYFCYTLTFIVYGRFDKAIFWCISDCFGRRHPFIWSSYCLRCDDNNRGCKFSLLLPWEWRYLRLRSIHIGFYSRNVCSFLWIDCEFYDTIFIFYSFSANWTHLGNWSLCWDGLFVHAMAKTQMGFVQMLIRLQMEPVCILQKREKEKEKKW